MAARGVDLAPYLPRLVLDWEREAPGVAVRELEGSLCFIDLSGFTAMSERLARLGKRGAEEVTAIVSDTFSTLLEVAYQADGTLLKFGGDALLLFFTGDGHAARACHAVHGMRATLRRLGAIATPAGPVRLRMSCGVHTGRFHFFLVGDSHRELVVTGPGASATAAMEGAAEAGQILVSEATAAALPERCTTPSGPGFLLVTPPPLPGTVDPELPSTERARPADFIPVAVRRHLAAGGQEPEHRQVAVAFVHFAGVDRLLADAGPPDVAGRLHALVAAAQRAAEDHDVCFLATDINRDGGKVILTAGTPHAHEDDDERLLRAVRAVVAADAGLEVSAGVHRGAVFAGDVGPFFRRTYTVMGDAVNTAARVMARAEPGEVLATAGVLQGAGGRFAAEELAPFAAKGKAAPIVAYRVGDPAQGGLAVTGRDTFVGRDAEVAVLEDLIARAATGAGGAVEVLGDPGSGKTALVEAIRRRHPNVRVAVLRGDRYESGRAYFPFRPLVRARLGLGEAAGPDDLEQALARLDPALVGELPFVAVVAGIDASHAAEVAGLADLKESGWKGRLFAAVDRLLAAWFDHLLIVVEDTQWLDAPTAELVRHLAAVAASRPWAVVATRRPGTPLLPDAVQLQVGPLPEADAVRLARQLAPVPLLPAQAKLLARRSGGNPLFLAELVAAFDPDAPADSLPATLEAVLAARIDRLPPGPRSLLRRLAVLGARFPTAAVGAVAGEAGGVSVLETLTEFVAVEGEEASFRQTLVHDVAYSGLPYRRRRLLHEQTALHLESLAADPDAEAEVLAVHYHEAERYDRSWHYSRIAAGRALRQYAFAESAAFWRRALDAARRLRGVSEADLSLAWRSLGDALRSSGRQAEAFAPYRTARRLVTGDRAAFARLCLLEGDLRQRLGRHTAGLRWYRRGLRLLDGDDLSHAELVDRVRLQMACGTIRYEQGRYREALAQFRLGLAEAEAVDDRPGQGHACNWLQLTYTARKEPGGDVYGRRALELYEEAGSLQMQAQALNSLALDARTFGRWDEAVELFRRSRQTLDAIGDPIAGAIVANNLGELLADQGRLPEARAALEDARATFQAARHVYEVVVAANLARVLSRLGEHDEANQLFADAGQRLWRLGLAALAAEAAARRAEHLVETGRAAEALAVLDEAEASPAALLLRVRALALAHLGQGEEARELLSAAVAEARAVRDDYQAALALASLGDLSGDEGSGHGAEAAAILERLGVVWRPALTLVLEV